MDGMYFTMSDVLITQKPKCSSHVVVKNQKKHLPKPYKLSTPFHQGE
jgi:hypothetical protein